MGEEAANLVHVLRGVCVSVHTWTYISRDRLTRRHSITGVSIARLHALIEFSKTTNPTYDNTPTIYWCSLEANLFIIVACMPAMHAIFRKTFNILGTQTTTDGYGSSNKNSYFGHDAQRSGGSLPFGKITKSTDVEIYRSARPDRNASDVELVGR